MSLSGDLKKLLIKEGATEVGFADLSEYGLKSGISIYMNIPVKSVKKFLSPSKEYYDVKNDFDNKLSEITSKAVEFLKSNGFEAEILSDGEKFSDEYVASRAGLGWIGKSSRLITSKYGSAVVLATILTDAPLDYGKPVSSSLCGMCRFCTSNCSNGVISGFLWNPSVGKDDLIDVKNCQNTDSKDKLCGKCIYICPHTQKYLKKG